MANEKDLMPKEVQCLVDVLDITVECNCDSLFTQAVIVGVLAHVSKFVNPLICDYKYAEEWGKTDKIVAYVHLYLKENAWNRALQLLLKYAPDEVEKAFSLIGKQDTEDEERIVAGLKLLLQNASE